MTLAATKHQDRNTLAEQAISEYSANTRAMAIGYRTLTRKYPDKWVAIHGNVVVASADTLSGVFEELAEKGIPARSTAVRYMSRKKRTIRFFIKMLRGFYDKFELCPQFEGIVRIPKLALEKFPITFLLDTGSDETVIMPIDAERICKDLGVPLETIEEVGKPDESYGSAGKSLDFIIPGRITFRNVEETRDYSWTVKFRFPKRTDDILGLPSLLGRDVISNWCLRLDPMNDIIEANVHRADRQDDL